MIQCKNCEYYEDDGKGHRMFKCDPFNTIKEPECLYKWQLMRMDFLAMSFRNMLSFQQRMAPMQDKIFKLVKRELEDLDEAERWKIGDEFDTDPPLNDSPDHDDPNSDDFYTH